MLEPVQDSNLFKCPNCAELIRRNAIVCRFCQAGLSKEHFHSCPHCAESVRVAAKFCRHCRSKIADSSLLKIDIHSIEKIFVDLGVKEQSPPISLSESLKQKIKNVGGYGSGVRQQVFEVIVRQALAGAPWKEICSGPMLANNISITEVEAELAKRSKDGISRHAKNSIGDLRVIEPAGLLQSIAISSKSGLLTVERQHKVFRGYFQNGKLTHARLGKLKGINAVMDLIFILKEGVFRFDCDESSAEFSQGCGLDKSLDYVLLECARAEDVSKKILSQLPEAMESVLQISENFDHLWLKLSEQHLRYCDGDTVQSQDKEQISAMSMLFTGANISRIAEIMDFWTTYEILRAIQLLIENNLLQQAK